MATQRLSSKVTFSIEIRQTTPEQKAAAKRLFSKLIEKARLSTQTAGQTQNIDKNR